MLQHGGHRRGGPWCPLALLVLAPLVTVSNGGPPECWEQAVSANGTLELLPKKPMREWARVKWRVGPGAESYQLILMARRNKSASVPKGSFSGRAVFQEEPLSLRISPVHAADAGHYEAEFEDPSGVVITRCFSVSVWEPLQPPHLETRVLHQERGWCNLSLLCTAPGAGPVSYSWSCTGDAAGAPEPWPRLHRQVHADADPTVCGCNVSNPASWSTANTSISAACRAAAAGLSSLIPGWAVAVAVLALAISIALVITFCWRRKRGKDPPAGHIEPTLTVYEEVGKAQTGRDPSATRDEATLGENTIYAVISKTQGPSLPREPESRTIYSRLQPSRKSPSLRRKRLDPALISTAYVEALVMGRLSDGNLSLEEMEVKLG
ncbi:natural killer cell receptor 2B4-like isoform X2 [Strigops habroptila]|uniref:natural killer cell receptor 2B4-like isoform X2 n=1 Tax=Strigops habroptila TaxID=2489341 RepID=UPI0011CF2FEA|nr:natural killer cell receptor 2B4-like isoform X2 [Strigops habroptila]